jgi:hypothetical protein
VCPTRAIGPACPLSRIEDAFRVNEALEAALEAAMSGADEGRSVDTRPGRQAANSSPSTGFIAHASQGATSVAVRSGQILSIFAA